MTTQTEQHLREKLASELGVSTWRGLLPDVLSKSLFHVSADLDLVEVGVHVALDHTGEVKQWLDSGALKRPSAEEMSQWEKEGSLFRFIVVEPYVFFQEYTVPQA